MIQDLVNKSAVSEFKDILHFHLHYKSFRVNFTFMLLSNILLLCIKTLKAKHFSKRVQGSLTNEVAEGFGKIIVVSNRFKYIEFE